MIKEMKINKKDNSILICLKINNSSCGCNSCATLSQTQKLIDRHIKRGYVINVMESDNDLLTDIENCIPAITK